MTFLKLQSYAIGALLLLGAVQGYSQIDPVHRNLLELGYDQPLTGQGPQALYAYYYYNNPDMAGTNIALRLAVAPAYLDGEIGFKHLLSAHTDLGIGIYGGGFSDNYYEVRQGDYLKGQSFYGHGGGASLNLYQLLDPGDLIPLNFVAQGGFRYLTYSGMEDTANRFTLPANRVNGFTRVGLRWAGKQPVLYPRVGLGVSVWFERQWRFPGGAYGFNGDRRVNAATDRYWLYAGINHAWTNLGYQVSFAVTAGGSTDADRFSAWRLGGVLPLVSEFPLILPGYYYQELTARRFVHLHGAFMFPLTSSRRLQFRLEAASALMDALPGFEQPSRWQTGAGCGLSYTSANRAYRIVVRYGYGFNAVRHGHEGAQSVGLLFQYNFEVRPKDRRS